MASGGLLKVDYDNLSLLSNTLTECVEFMSDDKNATSLLADAVGDARLAHKLNEFTDSWSIHRKKIAQDLESLRVNVDEVATQFETVDSELAAGLEG
ncbi:MAG: hypothetical protein ACRCSP_01865 [Rhodoglobus sp.]